MDSLFRFIFTALGWTIQGKVPSHVRKAVFAGAPHNTWKDLLLSLGLRAKLERSIGFLAKAELFKPPFGFVLKWLGGVSVIRNSKLNMVESYAQAVIKADDKLYAITPEGTRRNVKKLKTGFYYIALKAKIPIIRVGFDYPRKTVFIGESFVPTGDFNADMKTYFVPFFKEINGFQKDWIKNYEKDIFDE